MSYILPREAYIANTRNDASGTSGDSDNCNSFIKFTYKAKSDVEDLPLPHTCTHNTYARTHTHTHEQLCQGDLFLRSCDTQNCSLIARPLFSFPSLSVIALGPGNEAISVHTARDKTQSESRATSTLHKIKGSIINRIILVFYCYITQIKKSDPELSDVACRLSNKVTAERMNTKHYPNGVIFILSPPYTELKQREWKQISYT